MIFKNAISWFEIPTRDLHRAQAFYERIFGIAMSSIDLPQIQMRLFPLETPMGVGGALVHNPQFYRTSATDGPLLYLNGNPDVQIILDRVAAAGGQILVEKTLVSPEYGHMAVFLDTEGNRMALHSIPTSEG